MLAKLVALAAAACAQDAQLEQWGRAVEQVAGRLRRSVVLVAVERADGQRGSLTGVVVRPGGWVATDGSALRQATRVLVIDAGGAEHAAQVVGGDRVTGVALLRAAGLSAPPVEILDRPPRENEMILLCGNALGTPGSVFLGFAGGGRLQARIGERVVDDLVGLSVPAFPGDAGAAVADLHGRLLGIVIGAHRGGGDAPPMVQRLLEASGLDRGGVGAALVLPADVLALLVDDLADDGRVQRGHVGIAVRAGGEGDAGIVVTEVEIDSPAMRAPLYPRDVIQAVEGAAVSDPRQLRRILWRAAGRTLKFRVVRDGEVREVEVRVEVDRRQEE